DDITPLHTIGDTAATAAAHLFPPREAVRTRRAGFGRGGAGAGQNPPAGVVITYAINAARDVTLEFLDPRGTLIKSVSSTDRNGPAGAAGMHRYVWDMRYPDAHALDGGTFLAGGNLRGPVAVPGTYQVRMKTGGQTLTQPLRIVADPKSEAKATDLQEQFDLLIAIRDKVSAVHDAVNEIKRMRASLATRSDRAAARLDAALDAILKE